MAAYTDTVGFNKGSAAHLANSAKMYLMEVELNFTDITADRVAASLTALAATDSLAILNVPAKTMVMCVGIDVTTADGTASTVDLGETGGEAHHPKAVTLEASDDLVDQRLIQLLPRHHELVTAE